MGEKEEAAVVGTMTGRHRLGVERNIVFSIIAEESDNFYYKFLIIIYNTIIYVHVRIKSLY